MGRFTISPLSRLFALSDEQAMWRVQHENDHRAFTQLVERWEGPIRDLCIRMIGDVHRGEDLKQVAFARVFEKRNHYQHGSRFSTWLWRIALNVCYDELRRRRRRSELSFDEESEEALANLGAEPADEPAPDAQAAALEEGELVRQALMKLPEIYRTVLVLRHYEDLKLSKIAEILDIPEGTVGSRLAEGLARLARLLEPRLRDKKTNQPVYRPKELNVL